MTPSTLDAHIAGLLGRRLRHVFLVSVLLLIPLFTKAQDPAPADTMAVDSVKNPVICGLGMFNPADSSGLNYEAFLWSDTRSMGDSFKLMPGFFLRDLGGIGQPDQLSFMGLDSRGIAFLLDGRPLRNPVTGFLNVYEIPIEGVDHLDFRPVELFAGGTAGTMNIVTRHFSTIRPVTKIRFSQGPYEHLMTDVFYTQNVVRDLNFQIGLQRQVRENRFVNTSYDSWNVRTRVRFNMSDRFNVSLTDFYRSWTVGMNSGIDIDSTTRLGLNQFSDAEAIVLSDRASEERTQRDVTLSAIALLLADTASPTQMNAYFTKAERDYRDPSGLTSSPFDRYAYELHGVVLQQTIALGPIGGFAGLQVERRIAGLGPAGVRSLTMTAWYSDFSLHVSEFLRPSVFARGERVGASGHLTWGMHADVILGSSLAFNGGYSRVTRFPTLQELNWMLYRFQGPPDLLEQHEKIHLSLKVHEGPLTLEATGSERRIENALLFRTYTPSQRFPDIVLDVLPELQIRQLFGSLALMLWRIELKGGVMWTETKEGAAYTSFHPRFVLTGELTYRDVLFDGALEMQVGLQSRFVTRHTGLRFFPSHDLYAENSGRLIRTFSTMDLFGVFHVGDAFISIAWENPLDRKYMTVYPYPAIGRNVKVGINWVFLD
ncbi:MAG: TonB-dependent receptor plug domain-containing protein [Ignavibacteriales bacterium]|nr:TonB-dependent receptor plug domain-containing protein [Ignavibacteriales bacterium]